MKARQQSFLLALLLLALCVPAPLFAEGAEPITLTCLINHTWYPVSSFTGIIPEEITRRTGVTLDVTVAKDSRQLNMLIASGDMPDLIYTASQFDTLSNAQLCYDYDELIAAYDIDWEIDDDLRSGALHYSRDGKPYTVINHYTKTTDWESTASVPMTASLMIRQDMLDAMGIDAISTREELMDIYLRVRQLYPDIIPLTFDATHRFNIFRIIFGIGLAEFVQQPDETYRFYARDERYRDMLAFLNQLYQNDCLLIDNFAATLTRGNTLYKQGLSFSHSGCTQNYNMPLDRALAELDPGYHSVELAPLQGSSYTDSKLGWSGVFITRQNKNPEASIRFVAWMFTPEAQRLTQWGREGIDYTLNEDNLPVYSDAFMQTLVDETHNAIYNPWFYFGASAIVESEGRCAQLDFANYEGAYTLIREQYRNQPWIVAAMPTEGDPEKEIYDRIMAVVDTQETKVIISETDEAFEVNYREYMALLDALGAATLEGSLSATIPVMKTIYDTKGEQ